ncbi:TonB-dependent receptor [Gluconobacter oxydans]|uniref:TonB-dependent outer membrane receptor n=1 Tax=Gluconobacter oxydans (strain 621H) TaxID=290633 RepID=Q5FRA3_GLUOX|nr:TonB-dependent receptor [Gluconobacter oxydans]AAW61093.1 TonB-dependent outer membrane receptor [Gluconobacter oxydans 621H]
MKCFRLHAALLSFGVVGSWNVAHAASHEFNIDSSSLPAALARYQQITGIGVAVPGGTAQGIHPHAVKGVMDDQAALRALLAGTSLSVSYFDRKGAVLSHTPAPGKSEATPHNNDVEANDVEKIFSYGHRMVKSEKRTSNIIVDSIAYDPFENLGGNSSIASSLILLPGVAAIYNGDEPRYVSLRGISPDLNHTTVDGLTLASIGETGSGTRRVNLQDTPVEMTSHTNIYKSFTAEQSGDAIGGVIDMIPMSAFDHKGRYAYFDGYGIDSLYAGSAGQNGLSGHSKHMGAGEKAVISDRFGKNKEFGIIISSRYQDRVTNQTGSVSDFQYYDTSGTATSEPTSPKWNHKLAPTNYTTSEYANSVTTLGGSGKLEWRPINTGITASILGWTYRRQENQVGDLNNYNFNSNYIANQTATSGTQNIYSIYSRRIQDTYSRSSNGLIGHLDWTHGKHNVVIRAGYTWEDYDNYQPLERMRTYPSKLYANYSGDPENGEMFRIDFLSNPNLVKNATWKSYQMQQQWRQSSESIPTVRADYNYNIAPGARGFGLAAGFEWREFNIQFNEQDKIWNNGANVTSDAMYSNYYPWRWSIPFVFMNVNGLTYDWSKLSQSAANAATSKYNSTMSDYRYREDVTDGYLSLHYALPKTVFIAGVRADNVNYTSWSPTSSNGIASSNFARRNGSYINPLPSFDIVHHFPMSINLHASYSRSIGRPTPSNIAQAEKMTCGSSDETSIATCTISMGNPNLRPRKAHNFDVALDKFFDHDNGVLSATFFSKIISDDIYNQTSIYSQDGEIYESTTPMNATSSILRGVEFSALDRSIAVLGQVFDLSVNATWMQGHMHYYENGVLMRTNHLIYQPDVLVNGAVTWHIPAIHGGLQATANYNGKFLTGLGTTPNDNTGQGDTFMLNMAFWHRVYKTVSFKYEVQNLTNTHFNNVTGSKLQYTDNTNYLGRGVYFHLIMDYN